MKPIEKIDRAKCYFAARASKHPKGSKIWEMSPQELKNIGDYNESRENGALLVNFPQEQFSGLYQDDYQLQSVQDQIYIFFQERISHINDEFWHTFIQGPPYFHSKYPNRRSSTWRIVNIRKCGIERVKIERAEMIQKMRKRVFKGIDIDYCVHHAILPWIEES